MSKYLGDNYNPGKNKHEADVVLIAGYNEHGAGALESNMQHQIWPPDILNMFVKEA